MDKVGRDIRPTVEPKIAATGLLTVAVLAGLTYCNSLSNGFCDDGRVIVHLNEKVNAPGQWGVIWTTDYWSETQDATPNRDLLYRPVALSTYRLIGSLFGNAAFPQLLANLLLHVGVSMLVVWICRRSGCDSIQSIVAGVLFAVLPIHTEVINNIVGRGDLLASAGVLLALAAHRRAWCAVSVRSTVVWVSIASAAAFCAMGSKESGVAVVPIIIIYDLWWFGLRRRAEAFPASFLLRNAYLIAPTVVYGALRYLALDGILFQKPALSKTVNVLVDAPFWQHTLGVFQLWGMYWEKMLWPEVLTVNYSINAIRLATSVFNVHVLLGLAVTSLIAWVAVRNWRRGARGLAVACAAMAVAFVPTSNSIVLIQVFFAERIWYLPSIWAVCVVVWWLRPILNGRWARIAMVAICASMMVRCWVRNTEWKNNATLYAAAYRDAPNAIGALGLYGQVLVEEGRYSEGIRLLRKALDIDLGFTDVQRLIGQAYLRNGALDSALHHLQIAEMQAPGHGPTQAALRYVRNRLKSEESLKTLQRAADAVPTLENELELIRHMRAVSEPGEVIKRIESRGNQFQDSAEWQYAYAVTLVYANDRDRAIDRYAQALALRQGEAQWRIELAMLLLERRGEGDLEAAWHHALTAQTFAPDAAQVLVCLAELSAASGELDKAVAYYSRAIEALDSNDQMRLVYTQRMKALGG